MRSRGTNLVVSFVVAIIVTGVTGLILNPPAVSIPEGRYYGYPLYWLVRTDGQLDVAVRNLLVDVAVFWILSFVGTILLQRYR